MTKKQVPVVIVEAGHLSNRAISGGDKLIQPMINQIKGKYIFKIIIPKMARRHWQKKHNLVFFTLPKISFEKYQNIPTVVFFTYLWRSFFLFRILIKIKWPYFLYSSSAEFVDWFAPFIVKILLPNIKWIVRIHHLKTNPKERPGNLFNNYLSHYIEKVGLFCFKWADLIIVLNKNIYGKITKSIPSEKVTILEAGIDFEKISKFKPILNSPKYDAVFLGRVHHTKGVLDLPDIWEGVCKEYPYAKLAIIGELSIPQLEKELINKIANSKLENNIKILGFLPEKKALSILKNSKVFLFTDHEAGFGLAAAEAMAMGVPVVGWDIGILGKVFTKGYKKAPLKNYKEFASIIVKIKKDKKLRARLSKEAKNEASRFEWKKISIKFEKLLENLCYKDFSNYQK